MSSGMFLRRGLWPRACTLVGFKFCAGQIARNCSPNRRCPCAGAKTMCQRYGCLTESAFTAAEFVSAGALFAFSCGVGSCTDMAVLRNGFSIPHQHREQRGSQTRLYLEKTQENYVDVLTEDVVSFETDDSSFPQATPSRPRPSRPAQSLDQVVRAISSQNNI